ncbi:hypothetical protein CFC21_064156 [Triticum aestivum]|uniref:PGG domain-containing protein n=2 Tax=Triticum aestivum TaxID=4565 RepID=A0A3B6KA45_WHEAT|nr:uncharacterized protein LOC123102180 [Triticum aestivum]XP_048528234.1 uncharacterized protein LOC125507780 [Triticum urartu]KAF7056778.1 hypothetical protein CFC21_064156 [Triticum aestivum]
MQPAAMETGQGQPWEYRLRKYLLLLATLVASITYTAGFNPPGGVWQQKGSDEDGHRAGDHIINDTDNRRHLAFFYCNATAFIASLVVIVLILILAIRHDKDKDKKDAVWVASGSGVVPLRLVMVLDLLSLVGAYTAGTCRDKVSSLYSAALVAAIFIYIVLLKLLDLDWWWCFPNESSNSLSTTSELPLPREEMKAEERFRKVLMLLATFAVSITYVAGLSTPGGFWDSTDGSHRPGDAILKDHHSLRLMVFLLCNTTAFMASLFITMLLIIDGRKLLGKTARTRELYTCIIVALVSLVAAYAAGSCRKNDTTVYVVSLVGAVLAFILLLVLHRFFYGNSCSSPEQQSDENQQTSDNASACTGVFLFFSAWLASFRRRQAGDNASCSASREALDKTRSLVLLLATLAATITYSAGLDPPGGLWQDGDMAGNPILLTADARRYNVFYYCNSVSFVASLVVIILVQEEILVKHHVLEATMILDLFGLVGAYAAGSCRNMKQSIYAMALAFAVLGYVVIHVVFFTLDHEEKKNHDNNEDPVLEDRRKLLEERRNQFLDKRRKRLLLFAILAATITYQAGLTPPGGFLLQDKLGNHAGDPVLLCNDQRRYKAFFYCNSVSFMLSIALIILLVNPTVYRPAIESNALSVCTAVGLFCLMGAYAAGSTQDDKTSIYIFVLVALVLFVAAGLLVVYFVGERRRNANPAADMRSILEQDAAKEEEDRKKEEEERKEVEEKKKDAEERKKHARRKYLMLVGILVASVAYQAGLEPPGGMWQSSSDEHEAGSPVMQDNMRGRYLFFFYSNSISLVASIVVIIMLLPHWLPKKKEECEDWSLRVMNKTIILDLVALLGAYAAGSCRGWKTSMYVVALIVAVLGYFAIHMKLSLCRRKNPRRYGSIERQNSQGNQPV